MQSLQIKSDLKKGLNKSDSDSATKTVSVDIVHVRPVTSTTSDVSNIMSNKCTTTTTAGTSFASSESSLSKSRDISTFFDRMSASEQVNRDKYIFLT